MLKSPEMIRKAAVPLAAVFVLGVTACSSGEEERRDAPATSTIEDDGAQGGDPIVGESRLVKPRPLDTMDLGDPVPTLKNPQEWGKNDTLQIDSRNTAPVGGPVGVYDMPEQSGNSTWDVKDGDEYKATCYVDGKENAQFIQTDKREGTDVWYKIDVDASGRADGYVPAANAGFTGIAQDGTFAGGLPRC